MTSYTQLQRDAQSCQRWNRLHPTLPARRSFLEETLDGRKGPFIAASDYVRAVPEQVAPFVPGSFYALGTDGMGRSEDRSTLRRHFEVDAECIALAAMYQLSLQGDVSKQRVAEAIQELGVDPDKIDPLYA